MSNIKNISSNDSLASQGVLSAGNDGVSINKSFVVENDCSLSTETHIGSSDDIHTYASDVILDNGTYKMWYSGYDGSCWRIHYATSTDGVSWTKHGVVVPLGASGDSDDIRTYTPTVILDNGTYKMWYTGNNGSDWGIHYATSTDGVYWVNHDVVVSPAAPGDSDDIHTDASDIILDNGTYKMWYSVDDGPYTRIHYATSSDGVCWVKHGVVVPLGVDGTSDNIYTHYPTVILDNGTYKMWYIGYDGSDTRIHYATSTDGISWDKHGVVVPLGVDGDSDDIYTDAPTVILDNGTYKMWYIGYDGSDVRTHYATSTDGISWCKHGVVVTPGAADDSDDIHTDASDIILDNGTYKMWYSGYDGTSWRIHYATSTDGISWTKHGVVVPLGASGDSDDIPTDYPTVILDNGTYKMWCSGNASSDWRMSYATSSDGVHWTKHGVVVSPGAAGNSSAIHKEK